MKRNANKSLNISQRKNMYYHVFSTNCNLHFKLPAKDWDLHVRQQFAIINFKNKGDKSIAVIQKWTSLKKAELARTLWNNNRLCSGETTNVFTFDAEKAFPFPKLSTSVAYHQVNMHFCNFGVNCFNTKCLYGMKRKVLLSLNW